MIKASEIPFGIEIECNIPNTHSHEFPVGSYHHGIQSPVLPTGWNVQRDGSVTSQPGHFACEIVSPKLVGERGLVQVVQVLDYLDQIGARTNKSCGLHVHVSVERLSHQQINRVVRLFKHFEAAFYALNGKQYKNRYYNPYCRNSSHWDGSRYQSLNITNVDRGHIEIRVWSGTIKPEVVVAAIYMAVSMVSRATNEDLVKTSDLDQNNHTQVMASFIRQFVKGEHMIVEDLDPADLMVTMMQESVLARQQASI